jgi:hypothetical protein
MACTTLQNAGGNVSESRGTGFAPSPAGGALGDGTYVLTRYDVYPGASANTSYQRRVTLRITGGIFESISTETSAPTPLARAGFEVAMSGTLTVVWTCGASGNVQSGYTATPTTLILISQSNGETDVQTYAKQ